MPTFLHSLGEFFLDIIETVVIALSIFLVVYLFFVQPHQVNGQSMVPYFESGEYVLTDKISYKLGEPKRGDIVVFHAPEAANCPKGTGCDFIKRVLGLPGDSIQITNDSVVVNGTPLNEPYLPDEYITLAGAYTKNRTVNLGPDEYFVVGDNRPYSSDSRAWGPINKSMIVGRAFFRYLPVNKMMVIPRVTYQ